MNTIKLKPIGIIHTPYHETKDIPIQGKFRAEGEGYAELDEKYIDGLIHLDDFSHAFLIYHFHRSDKEHIQGKPFLEDETHGIFAIRSPHRPNHLGISIVRIIRIEKNRIYFAEADMLDGTPVLDIKPYIKHFDCREDVVSGWVDKHFENGQIPSRTILNKES
ncbi:tRNA (N6-threonylcarbamoyladenosine(37)-N6)-methyltransferase TrmO [candidate division KSB1 bacterium]|nr:tRNA (N6-threonylcarbamoyladenosine(37)-N6)-methyltransferase TrmO [candidate division KSB1 bacterium]